jgi:AmmeMemoRadiSam system protein B
METPFGRVKTDYDLARALVDRTRLVDHNLAHLREHAVEVHLPFLQFISKKEIDNLRIVAIVVGMTDYNKLGSELRAIVSEMGKKICVIASSDFTHHGQNFGYKPYTENIKEGIEKLDKGAYAFIERNDSKGLLKYIEETGATVCGIYPILVLLEFLDGKKSELLCHYSSGSVTGDYENCVDYMSIVFRS